MSAPEAEPQGNAMSSVRVTAAGAVVVALLSFLTTPARACDDRFIKKCEKQAAATAAADESASAPVVRRKSGKRMRMVALRRGKQMRVVRRMRAPGFALRRARETGASMSALPAESVMARRFRGFIDPQPIAQNAFEALRKPHPMNLNLDPAAILPLAQAGTAQPSAEPVASATPAATAAPAAPAAAAPAAPTAPTTAAAVVTTPKQDKVVAKPAALMELASAESKPVTLPEPKPAAVAEPKPVAAVLPAPVVQQAFVTEAPAPAGQPPNRFSIHQLVLALCGALGAASALRFIVGA